MLTVGGLFSGIGGWELGLERAGMRVLWHCEADPYARAVLEQWWPGVPCYPDVRDLRADDVEPVDVLCGGFPCQDLSYAGKGAGIDGARSGLWGEYARLVGELRPRYVLVENVSALLARGLGVVLGDLAALGFDAEWDCLPASAFGANHRRDRIWLVAYPNGERQLQPRGSERNESRRASHGCSEVAYAERRRRFGGPAVIGRDDPERDAAEWCQGAEDAARGGQGAGDPRDVPNADGERLRSDEEYRRDQDGLAPGGDEPPGDVADADQERRDGRPGELGPGRRDEPTDGGRGELQDADGSALQPWRVGGRAAQAGGPEWWAVEPPVGRVAHGVPDRLDQLACLGNALVPQIAEWIGRRVIDFEEGRVAA